MMSGQPEILCCPLAAIDDELLAAYRLLLNADEQQRLAGYRSPSAAKEFLAGRALLRIALSQRLQCEPTSLVFARDADGKPHLSFPENSGWHFNLSHDRNWAVLMVSGAGPVGIDVEGHERRNNLPAIARRFFSPAENRALDACDQTQWQNYFFAIWTLKEAHAKARGCGLSKILSCSSITLDWPAEKIHFELHGIARSDMPLSGWLYRLEEGVSLAAIANDAALIAEPSVSRVVPLRSNEPLPLTALAHGGWLP